MANLCFNHVTITGEKFEEAAKALMGGFENIIPLPDGLAGAELVNRAENLWGVRGDIQPDISKDDAFLSIKGQADYYIRFKTPWAEPLLVLLKLSGDFDVDLECLFECDGFITETEIKGGKIFKEKIKEDKEEDD
ncbi:MAG: hypothetical protein ACYCSQ_00230 [bacterium]